MELGGVASGLLVKSYDGRPIKIEGNPDEKYSHGSTTPIEQASVLELYDPDRSRGYYQRQQNQVFRVDRDQFITDSLRLFDNFKNDSSQLRFLSEKSSSVTTRNQIHRIRQAFPQAKWIEFEPVNMDNEIQGTTAVFGAPLRVHYDIRNTQVLLSLDANLFGTHPAAKYHAWQFIQKRKPELGHDMCRFYMVESTYTNTGALSDHRLPVPHPVYSLLQHIWQRQS